jgi:hypothetical protein
MPASFTQEEYSFDVLSEPLAWLTRCGACSIGCVVGSHSMLFDQDCVVSYGRVAASLRVFIFSYGRVSGTQSASVREIECVFRSLGQAVCLVLISVSDKCDSDLNEDQDIYPLSVQGSCNRPDIVFFFQSKSSPVRRLKQKRAESLKRRASSIGVEVRLPHI